MATLIPSGGCEPRGGRWVASAVLTLLGAALGGCAGDTPGDGGPQDGAGTDPSLETSAFCAPLLERMDSFAVAFSSAPVSDLSDGMLSLPDGTSSGTLSASSIKTSGAAAFPELSSRLPTISGSI